MYLLTGMQQEQPQFYATLAGHLTPDEQNLVQGVVNQAEALILVQQQQQQQQALAQGASNGGVS